SKADAERSWKRMQSLYPEEMQGLSPSYKTAEVPGKGTVVRLRAGTLSREEANARCNAIRAVDPRGGGCLVLRN
ncbi:MAG TPA: SPOR domain-containing protein, partial [Alphaproteobacteria bacterium]